VTDKAGSIFASLARNELASRAASAIGLALVAIGATAIGGAAFALLWSLAASLFLGEFLVMIGYRPLIVGAALGSIGLVAAALGLEGGSAWASLAALALAGLAIGLRAHGKAMRLLGPAGLLYAACVVLPVVALRQEPRHGLALTLWLYALVWATDIGAFFVGRGLGGPKLWKRVSPNKTWSGFIGGTLIGIGAASLATIILPAFGLSVFELAWPKLLAVALTASLAAHAGDLLESALKRRFSIKDSSHLIPGHGGFMDRLDGFALASLAVTLALRIGL
jgi:phosphatidate cytidylyltransferase